MAGYPQRWRLVLLLCIVLVPLAGCGGDESAADSSSSNASDVGDFYNTPPEQPPATPESDPQESWKKFYAQAKGPERLQAAQGLWKALHPGGKLQVKFLRTEMQYTIFGQSPFKGVDPQKTYEVGIVTLAAKEETGNGHEIRQYELQFIRKGGPEEWSFIMGNFVISSKAGSPTKFETGRSHLLDEPEYDGRYLKALFTKPFVPPEQKRGGGGGDQAVETQIPVSP